MDDRVIIRVDSGTVQSVLEVSEPLPVERLSTQDQGGCQGCVPISILNTLTQFESVPAACFPLPEGATIQCPEISVLCATGLAEPLGPWLVGVPLVITVPAHPVAILTPDGAPLCTVEVAAVTFPPSRSRVTCPTTEGVRCTCTVSPITCQGCSFEFGGELVACRFRFLLTLSCLACPPVRGLGRLSTPL